MSESGRYAAIVVDAKTGKVLFARNPDGQRFPASLTKMMTLYVLFEELERGRMTMSTPLEVSPLAASQAPSKLGLRPGETIEVGDAIRALVTKSANDAAVVIAENVSGSVEAFAARMTRTAQRIGMTNSVFRNPNGLPNPAQTTTARDMVTLGMALQDRFPDYYRLFSTRAFAWRGSVHANHNKLLGRVEGVDGIKTGYTAASGFNLVSSVKRDGRTIVAAVMGGPTGRARDAHMVQLIETYLPEASRGAKTYAVLDNGPKEEAPSAARRPASAAVATELPRPDEKPVERGAAVAMAKAILLPDQGRATGEPLSIVPPAVARVAAASAFAPPVPIEPEPAPAVRKVQTVSMPVPPAPVAPAVPVLELPQKTVSAGVLVPPAGIPGRGRTTAFADPVTTQSTAERKTEKAVEREAEPARTDDHKGWMIQIAAVDREADARAILSKARGEAGRVLSGREPVTEAVSKGGTTLYRARFAGFSDQATANAACATLKRKDFSCLAVRQ
ncbi:SPOR domain-containing protein [Prosthecomicrobium sp. N25]|uniref:SPOR domain-containing protein n=1 Tax=Prosthecomicrobium sp. N25 TaxID=3129254 RepID=UPI003076963C